ncbi:Unknown protein sequence [Pseudomonas syringae pv. syringae]|nr:Unknown protein sequence [Pseudomonas syringae pv. syringae]
MGLLDRPQFEKLTMATVQVLNHWEAHHAGMNADGRLSN